MRIWEMSWLQNRTTSVRLAVALVLGGLSLSACATKDYVNEQIATVNMRVDAVDAKATDAIARADAANTAAQGANAAAQAAATDARTANQRLDQLGARVDTLEQMPKKRPRH
jgi:hypothetical protein